MNWLRRLFSKSVKPTKLRDPLQYAIDEGFIEVLYWAAGQPTHLYSGTIGCKAPFTEETHASVMYTSEGWRLTVLGVSYSIGDTFFIRYGTRTEDSLEAATICKTGSSRFSFQSRPYSLRSRRYNLLRRTQPQM